MGKSYCRVMMEQAFNKSLLENRIFTEHHRVLQTQ